jgi:hypothetical protein
MDKVVHFFNYFKIIFYLKKIELRKVTYGSIKLWNDLNLNLNQIKLPPPGTVAGGPPISLPAHLPCLQFKRQCRTDRRSPPPWVHSAGAGPPPQPRRVPPFLARRVAPNVETPLLSFPTTDPPFKTGTVASHAPFLPLSCSKRTTSAPSHTPLHLVRCQSPESRRLNYFEAERHYHLHNFGERCSLAIFHLFLMRLTSPPPHLAVGTARGRRGPPEHPTASEHHPDNPAPHLTVASHNR